MHYLVDGHNLIPKIQGLSLRAMDDEEQLIRLLQEFHRIRRHSVEVYFDKAPAGQAVTRRYGSVTAHFIREGMPADDAIIARLRKAGKQAREFWIVTSDRRILAEIRNAQAHWVSSEEFASQVEEAMREAPVRSGAADVKMGEEEVQAWLRLFKEGKKKD